MAHDDDARLTATYDDATDTVVMERHTFVEGEPFRGELDAGLDLAKQEGAEDWLADLRDLGTVDQDDQDWFSRVMETTLTNMAIVHPESVVANRASRTSCRRSMTAR